LELPEQLKNQEHLPVLDAVHARPVLVQLAADLRKIYSNNPKDPKTVSLSLILANCLYSF